MQRYAGLGFLTVWMAFPLMRLQVKHGCRWHEQGLYNHVSQFSRDAEKSRIRHPGIGQHPICRSACSLITESLLCELRNIPFLRRHSKQSVWRDCDGKHKLYGNGREWNGDLQTFWGKAFDRALIYQPLTAVALHTTRAWTRIAPQASAQWRGTSFIL